MHSSECSVVPLCFLKRQQIETPHRNHFVFLSVCLSVTLCFYKQHTNVCTPQNTGCIDLYHLTLYLSIVFIDQRWSNSDRGAQFVLMRTQYWEHQDPLVMGDTGGLTLYMLASVCGSVHKPCKHDTDWTVPARSVKLGTHTTYDKRMTPIDFQC